MAWRISPGPKGKLYQSEVMSDLSFALSQAIRLQVLMNCSRERHFFVSGPLRTSQTEHLSETLPPQHNLTGKPTHSEQGPRRDSVASSSYHIEQSAPGSPGAGSGSSRLKEVAVAVRGPGGGCG